MLKLEDNLLDADRTNSMLQIPTVASDFVTFLCGKFLGSGTFRSVFECNFDDRFVVKVEPRNTNCNIVEYMIWEEVQYLKGNLAWVKDWFAPIEWISPNGRILIMRRTKDYPKRKKPEKIPKFLWDIKPNNFGWYKGNYVCHDYGQFYNFIEYKKGFKKIDWAYWE